MTVFDYSIAKAYSSYTRIIVQIIDNNNHKNNNNNNNNKINKKSD